MSIVTALTIPGWMTERELTFLAEAAATHQRIAEIGCWRGRSTRALVDNTKGLVYAVDTWDDAAVGLAGWWTTPQDIALRNHRDWLYNEFMANVPQALLYRTTSLKAAATFRESGITFDMIFIDASHDYASVRDDIAAWRGLLEGGGLFCGHDYLHPLCPEVKKAVDEALPQFYVVDTIWVEGKRCDTPS